ncbi:MAG: S41 family peptidase [Fimbriimonadaceae bacterium]|jgi:carboxyl-terminal processing protease|nr:S41 family peptidase [Fimbriimonadaceae bacterium]
MKLFRILPLLALASALLIGKASAQTHATPPSQPGQNQSGSQQDQRQRTQPTPEPYGPELKVKLLADIRRLLTEVAFVPDVDFKKWDEMIAANQAKLDAAQNENEFAREVNAALRQFGISHVRLVTPRSARARTQSTAIGTGISARSHPDGLEVTTVVTDSPAAKAGLKSGDVIILVNGKKPTSPDDLPREANSQVTLSVRNAESTREIQVTSGEFRTRRQDSLTWIDEKTAVLRVWSFATGYERRTIDTLMQEAKKAEYLVLDLRNNGGGAVTNLAHLLGHFLSNGTEVGTFVGRGDMANYLRTQNVEKASLFDVAKASTRRFRAMTPREASPFQGKVAVLINRGTGSASEITTAALKELKDAIIVGQPTAGAVLASQFRRISGGFELQIPLSDYVTIKGVRLEGNPWKPDITTDGRFVLTGPDATLDAALKALKGA